MIAKSGDSHGALPSRPNEEDRFDCGCNFAVRREDRHSCKRRGQRRCCRWANTCLQNLHHKIISHAEDSLFTVFAGCISQQRSDYADLMLSQPKRQKGDF